MIRECGAKARSNGYKPCKRIASKNGRCHLHGGATPRHNTGPKTEEGKLLQKRGSWKHGGRSKETTEAARLLKEIISEGKRIISSINEGRALR